eukprot:425513_1
MSVETLSAIQFWSSIIGIIISIFLYCPLIYRVQHLIQEHKLQSSQPLDVVDESVTITQNINTTLNTTTTTRNKFCSHLELWSSFGCISFSFLYLIQMSLFSRLGNIYFLNITYSVTFCNIMMRILGLSYQTSRYFFYLFMLYRIKLTFQEQTQLQLSKNVYKLNILLIHFVIVFSVFIVLLCHYRIDNDSHSNNQECVLNEIFISNTNISVNHLWACLLAMDTLLTMTFFYMYLKRMCQLTGQNQTVNLFIWRVMISGLIAITSSMVLTFCSWFIGYQTRYFMPIDQTINSICIVITFKPHFMLCQLHSIQIEHQNENNNDNDISELMDLFDEDGNLSMHG